MDFKFDPDVEPIEMSLLRHPRGIGSDERFAMIRADTGGIEYRMIVERAAELARMASEGTLTDPEDAASSPILHALAYKLSGDEKMLDLSRRDLALMLTREQWNISPETSNFDQLQRAQGVAVMYDVLYDSLDDELRKDVEAFLVEHVIPMVRYKTYGAGEDVSFWINDPHSNYYVVWHATLGWLAIVLGDKLKGYETDAAYAWERLQAGMDLMVEENGWREGLTYLDFCWGQKALYFLLALKRNSAVDPFEGEFLAKSAEHAAYGILPGGMGSNSFGDNEPLAKPVASYILRMRAMYPHGNWDRILAMPDSHEGLDHDAWVFYAMAEPAGGRGWEWIDEMSLSMYFPGIEWVVVRSSWDDPDAMYFACKSGIGGYGHNHLDQGSIILAAFGEWFLFDKGVGGDMSVRWADPKVNNYFEAPIGHNTLVVGDGIYEDLWVWPDNPRYFAKPGKILDYRESNDGRVITFTADASGLFATEPVELFRRYVCVRISADGEKGHSIFIVDDIRLSAPSRIATAWHSPVEWFVQRGFSNGGMEIKHARGELLQSFVASGPHAPPIFEYQDTGMADRSTYVMMLGARMEGTDWRAAYQLQLKEKSSTAPDADAVGHSVTGFVFNPGPGEVMWDMETKSWTFKKPLD